MKLYKKLLPLVGVPILISPTVLSSCSRVMGRVTYTRSDDQPYFVYDTDIGMPEPTSLSNIQAMDLLMNQSLKDVVSSETGISKGTIMLPNEIAYYKANTLIHYFGSKYFEFDNLSIEVNKIEVEEIENVKNWYLTFNVVGSGTYTDELALEHNFTSFFRVVNLHYNAWFDEKVDDNNYWLITPQGFKEYLESESTDPIKIFNYLAKEPNWYVNFSLDIEDRILASGTLSKEAIDLLKPSDAREFSIWTEEVMVLASFFSHFLENIDHSYGGDNETY